MVSYREEILDFVTELAKSVDVLSTDFNDDVCVFKTNKYFINIYLPHSSRIMSDTLQAVIHLDIDQIISSKRKIIQRIVGLHGLGERIYARQTVVARVDKKNTINFLEEHHINLSMPGKYRYGLFYKGELVSIAVFSGGRLMRDLGEGYRSFELIRFCHKGSVLVVGGLSKLLKSFIKDFVPQDIMTYVDLDWTKDSSLETIGFEVVGKIDPLSFYIKDNIRYSVSTDQLSPDYLIKNNGSLKLKLTL